MRKKKVNMFNLIAIVGPTASGKSDLAIKLAKKFNGVIISADSRQIYKGLPIGTNQPKGKWRKFPVTNKAYFVQNVPHFFIDILPPSKKYNVAAFQKNVYRLLPKLQVSGYLPILVGGTGLYVSSIVEGYQFPEGKPNLKLRGRLDKLSTTQLLKKIKKIDLNTFQKIDKKNRRRIIRALEYHLTTRIPFSRDRIKKGLTNHLILGLNPPRADLYNMINRRVDKMMKRGLLKEVRRLIKNYAHSPALATIGYQELVPVIKTKANLEQAVGLIKQHTRNFAKRQMTWFKRIPNVQWIKATQADRLVKRYVKPQLRIYER